MNKFVIKLVLPLMLITVSACQMNKQEPAPVISYEADSASMQQPYSMMKHPDYITVRSGDSLGVIAGKYQIPTHQIVTFNDLKPPYNLLIGQKLWLKRKPLAVKKFSKSIVHRKISNTVPIIRQPLITAPITNKVPPVIQPANQISPSAVRNNKTNIQNGEFGKKLVTTVPPQIVINVDKISDVQSSPRQIIVNPTEDMHANNSEIICNNDNIVHKPVTQKNHDMNTSQPKFAWPIKGKILNQFGALDTGFQNDGINIEAREGDTIRAADDGIVAYVGNELQGFGNLIMIKHQLGWMSAYAHCSEFLVKRGDKLKRGDKIALVGHTGNVRTPQLHFELRKKTKAVDPLPYLE